MNSGPARGQNSQQRQTDTSNLAYHGEIGREATAFHGADADLSRAYHGEIGREATADFIDHINESAAYHGEIGREATAAASKETNVYLA